MPDLLPRRIRCQVRFESVDPSTPLIFNYLSLSLQFLAISDQIQTPQADSHMATRANDAAGAPGSLARLTLAA